MKIGYICTNYNNSKYTVDAVRSLAVSSAGRHELRVIIVDNQSEAEYRATLEQLAGEFPFVDIVFNKENVGYFAGLNCGLLYARAKYPDFEYLVIGNNDLKFSPNFCSQFEMHCKLLDVHAVIAPDIVTLDGEHQNPQVVKSISKSRELIYDIYYSNFLIAQVILWIARVTKTITDRKDELEYTKAQYIYQGHGSCYLIGPTFFANFSELWAPTFLMGEEFFLSKQLADKDMQVFYTPSIQVIHCCHGSLKLIPSKKIWVYGKKAHKLYRKFVKVYK